jgi:hypothetical protein
MLASSAADVFPRTQQAVGAKNYDHIVLHRSETYEFDAIPRGSIFNQLYFINNRFPDLKAANLNFRRQKTGSTFGCTWIIPSAKTDRRSRQKLERKPIFPEGRVRPIHRI